jgi:hypothetical protein
MCFRSAVFVARSAKNAVCSTGVSIVVGLKLGRQQWVSGRESQSLPRRKTRVLRNNRCQKVNFFRRGKSIMLDRLRARFFASSITKLQAHSSDFPSSSLCMRIGLSGVEISFQRNRHQNAPRTRVAKQDPIHANNMLSHVISCVLTLP